MEILGCADAAAISKIISFTFCKELKALKDVIKAEIETKVANIFYISEVFLFTQHFFPHAEAILQRGIKHFCNFSLFKFARSVIE